MSNAFRVNRYACPKTEIFRQPENQRNPVKPQIEYVPAPRPVMNLKRLDLDRARAADRPLVVVEHDLPKEKPRKEFVAKALDPELVARIEADLPPVDPKRHKILNLKVQDWKTTKKFVNRPVNTGPQELERDLIKPPAAG